MTAVGEKHVAFAKSANVLPPNPFLQGDDADPAAATPGTGASVQNHNSQSRRSPPPSGKLGELRTDDADARGTPTSVAKVNASDNKENTEKVANESEQVNRDEPMKEGDPTKQGEPPKEGESPKEGEAGEEASSEGDSDLYDIYDFGERLYVQGRRANRRRERKHEDALKARDTVPEGATFMPEISKHAMELVTHDFEKFYAEVMTRDHTKRRLMEKKKKGIIMEWMGDPVEMDKKSIKIVEFLKKDRKYVPPTKGWKRRAEDYFARRKESDATPQSTQLPRRATSGAGANQGAFDRLYEDAAVRSAAVDIVRDMEQQALDEERLSYRPSEFFHGVRHTSGVHLSHDSATTGYGGEGPPPRPAAAVVEDLHAAGELYQLRAAHRRREHEEREMEECSFQPRTNDQSRWLMHRYAKTLDDSQPPGGNEPETWALIAGGSRPDDEELLDAVRNCGPRGFRNEREALVHARLVQKGRQRAAQSAAKADPFGAGALPVPGSEAGTVPPTPGRVSVGGIGATAAAPAGRPFDAADFNRRLQRREAERRQRIAALREEIATEETSECTFRPAISATARRLATGCTGVAPILSVVRSPTSPVGSPVVPAALDLTSIGRSAARPSVSARRAPAARRGGAPTSVRGAPSSVRATPDAARMGAPAGRYVNPADGSRDAWLSQQRQYADAPAAVAPVFRATSGPVEDAAPSMDDDELLGSPALGQAWGSPREAGGEAELRTYLDTLEDEMRGVIADWRAE